MRISHLLWVTALAYVTYAEETNSEAAVTKLEASTETSPPKEEKVSVTKDAVVVNAEAQTEAPTAKPQQQVASEGEKGSVNASHHRPTHLRHRTMIRAKMQDGSMMNYYFVHGKLVTYETAKRSCEAIGMDLAPFETTDAAVDIIGTFRKQLCEGCKGMLWIKGVMDKESSESCPHASVRTGVPSDGEFCKALNFRNEDYKAILNGYVCAEKARYTNVKEESGNEQLPAESMIPFKRGDGRIVHHYIVRNTDISFKNAENECKASGYQLSTFDTVTEFRRVARFVSAHGSYWIGQPDHRY
ncbi:hypothetical protein Y032_0449g1664 [Ancylostoma ceylanicum]|uniref:C-type lectin domain-containing protein n=1 Tax=Ancylostoma ceylanicum TaxID=53326 RepID=A0A016WYY4_9BILA|nr:hypothetical protein Y032_0449g1664 [Ancylostoma ceylanicum]